MSRRTNRERAQLGRDILRTYQERTGTDAPLTDLLADLMHHHAASQLGAPEGRQPASFDLLLGLARHHFEEERAAEDPQQLAEAALDAAIATIQDALGVQTGDHAGQYWSDNGWRRSIALEQLRRYAENELDTRDDD